MMDVFQCTSGSPWPGRGNWSGPLPRFINHPLATEEADAEGLITLRCPTCGDEWTEWMP